MPRPVQTTTKPRTLPRGFTWDATRKRVVHQWADASGRMRKVRGVDVAACREARAAMEATEPEADEPAGSSLTFTGLTAAWLPTVIGGKSASYVDTLHRTIAKLGPYLDHRPVASLTAADYETAMAGLIAAGVAKSTFPRFHSIAGRAFKYGVRHGLIAASPMDGAIMPTGGAAGRAHRWLDVEEFRRLRSYLVADAASTYHVMALTALMTGLRPGELHGLRWDAVDFERGAIHVRSALHAGPYRRSVVVSDELKTEGARRSVDMAPMLAAVLHAHKARQAAAQLAAPAWTDHGLAFTTRTGSPVKPQHFADALAALCRSAGVTEVAPNGLRHSVATFMILNGETFPEVARQLGHKNTRMVITTYGHLGKADIPARGVLAS